MATDQVRIDRTAPAVTLDGVQASYPRSYKILEHARRRGAVTKTGLMLGLGETREEVEAVLGELAALGVDIVTLGQYLSPSKQHLPIERYVHPTEFAELEQHAREAGITHVVAGPLVRSSYHADGQAQLVREQARPLWEQAQLSA